MTASFASRVFREAPDSADGRSDGRKLLNRVGADADFRQAILRIPLGAAALAYLHFHVRSLGVHPDALLLTHLRAVSAAWFGTAAVLLLLALLGPAPGLARRLVAVVLDLVGIALILQSAGEPVSPVMLIMFWVMIGHGIRGGPRVMAVAVAIALINMARLWWDNPFWHAYPHLSASLGVTFAVLPAYAMHLVASVSAANRMLHRGMAARARVLARAGHDLRHPLHALGIFSERLAGTDLDGAQRRLLAQIDMSLSNTTEMLRTYLDLASIEATHLHPRPTVFPLQRLFDELSDAGRAMADRAAVRFYFMRTARHVRADRTLLKAMLQNLIVNVVHHAPGARTVVGCRLDGGRYTLQVRDDGGRSAPRRDGDTLTVNHGLGLSIVRDLARAQGLRIWINEAVRSGFDIRIQGLTPATSEELFAESEAEPPAFQPLRGTRVLLVESDASLRAETTGLLHQWGCRVVACADLPEHGGDAEVAVINARARMRVTGRALHKLATPVILIGDAGGAHDGIRAERGRLVKATRPVTPAQLRSMLMSVR